MTIEEVIRRLMSLDVDMDLPVVLDVHGATWDVEDVEVANGLVRLKAAA